MYYEKKELQSALLGEIETFAFGLNLVLNVLGGFGRALTLTLSSQPGPPLCGLTCAESLEILNHHHPNFTSSHFSSLAPAAAILCSF